MGKLILLLLLVIVLLATGPLITIWSINTLFGLGIAYSFWTWLAVLWLLMVTFGQGTAKKRG